MGKEPFFNGHWGSVDSSCSLKGWVRFLKRERCGYRTGNYSEIRNLVIRLQVKMRSKVRRHISLYDSSDLEGMLAVMFSVVAAQKE